MSVSLYDTISRVILYIFKGTIDYADIVGTYNANGIYIQSHLTNERKKNWWKNNSAFNFNNSKLQLLSGGECVLD